MNDNKILKQFHALFGIFMVAFYVGFGVFILFFAKMFAIPQPIRVMLGSTFIFYGLYRITVTYKQISEAFFSKHDDQE